MFKETLGDKLLDFIEYLMEKGERHPIAFSVVLSAITSILTSILLLVM